DAIATEVDAVVHLWSLDCPAGERMTEAELETSQVLICGSALHIVQALIARRNASAAKRSPSLWWVTNRAQVVRRDDDVVSTAQAPLWGLAQGVTLEHPAFGGALIDLDEPGPDGVSMLIDEIGSSDREHQVAFRENRRYVSRLVRTP